MPNGVPPKADEEYGVANDADIEVYPIELVQPELPGSHADNEADEGGC